MINIRSLYAFAVVCALLLALLVACASTPPSDSPGSQAGILDADSLAGRAAGEAVPPDQVGDAGGADAAELGSLRASAQALFDEKRYDEAEDVLVSYLALDPHDYDVNMQLAFIYFNRGDYEDALPCYRAAVDAKPTRVDSRVGLAKTLEQLGRTDNAIRAYEGALEIRGYVREMEPVIIAQANLLNQRGKYDRTLELVQRAGTEFPETPGLACARGMALAGEGRYDEAIAAFGRATGDPRWSEFANAQIRRIQSLR